MPSINYHFLVDEKSKDCAVLGTLKLLSVSVNEINVPIDRASSLGTCEFYHYSPCEPFQRLCEKRNPFYFCNMHFHWIYWDYFVIFFTYLFNFCVFLLVYTGICIVNNYHILYFHVWMRKKVIFLCQLWRMWHNIFDVIRCCERMIIQVLQCFFLYHPIFNLVSYLLFHGTTLSS